MQHFTARLTRDAAVKTLKDGRKVVNFSVAKNAYYKTKSGEAKQQTAFYQCAFWLNTGIAKYLKKGVLVDLFGRVSVDAYTGKDGEPKAALQLHTSHIEILHRQSVKAEPAESEDSTNDDLPF